MVSDMTHQEFAEIYLNYVVMAFANLAPHVVNISNVVPDSWNSPEKSLAARTSAFGCRLRGKSGKKRADVRIVAQVGGKGNLWEERYIPI